MTITTLRARTATRLGALISAIVVTASAATLVLPTSAHAQPVSQQTKLSSITLQNLGASCAANHGTYHAGPGWGECLLPGGGFVECWPQYCYYYPALTSVGTGVEAPAPIGNRPVALAR